MTSPEEEFTPDEGYLEPNTRDPEAPTADAAEQAIPARPADTRVEPKTAFEAADYDALEQSRVVDLDDDY